MGRDVWSEQEPTTRSPQASPHREVAMMASRELENERLGAQMDELSEMFRYAMATLSNSDAEVWGSIPAGCAFRFFGFLIFSSLFVAR